MPELPEIEAIAAYLREHAVGRRIERIDVASLSVLKTAAPPWIELIGQTISTIGRHGKYLDVGCGTAGLRMIVHLARAGWLRWSQTLAAQPPKPGKGPLALRVHLGPPGEGPGFDLTEAGTKKGLAMWVVTDPLQVPGIAKLGPDALSLDRDQLVESLTGHNGRLKNVLVDQSIIAGIGNAYSDEILHAARLSPYASVAALSADAFDQLYAALRSVLTDAVVRSVGQHVALLKGEKRSGLRVHGRTGLPCPVCGDTVREVAFADKSLQYCPTCQTGGKPLADRRLSRFVK